MDEFGAGVGQGFLFDPLASAANGLASGADWGANALAQRNWLPQDAADWAHRSAQSIADATKRQNTDYDFLYGNSWEAYIARLIGQLGVTFLPATRAGQLAAEISFARLAEATPMSSRAAKWAAETAKGAAEGTTAGLVSTAMTSSAHPEPFNEQLKVGLPLSALAGAAFPQLGYLASAASRAMPQRMRLPFGDNSQPAAIGGWLGGEIAPFLAPFGRTIATNALHDFYRHLFGSPDQKRDPGSGGEQNGTPQR